MFLFYIKNLFNFLKCVYFSRQYFTFSFLLIMTNKQIMYIQFTQSILFWFSYATLEGISGYILYISYMKRKSFSLLNILRCFDGERKKNSIENCHNFCFIFQVRKTMSSRLIKNVIQNSISIISKQFSQ